MAPKRPSSSASERREKKMKGSAKKKDSAGAERKKIKSEKYTHVHMFVDTGRWGAWVRELIPKGERLYVGTHLTDNLAARCQDRAVLKLEGESTSVKPISLNFDRKDYDEDQHMRDTLTRKQFFDLLRAESRGSYTKVRETECLRKFLEQERALGNLPSPSVNNIPLPTISWNNKRRRSSRVSFDEKEALAALLLLKPPIDEEAIAGLLLLNKPLRLKT